MGLTQFNKTSAPDGARACVGRVPTCRRHNFHSWVSGFLCDSSACDPCKHFWILLCEVFLSHFPPFSRTRSSKRVYPRDSGELPTIANLVRSRIRIRIEQGRIYASALYIEVFMEVNLAFKVYLAGLFHFTFTSYPIYNKTLLIAYRPWTDFVCNK